MDYTSYSSQQMQEPDNNATGSNAGVKPRERSAAVFYAVVLTVIVVLGAAVSWWVAVAFPERMRELLISVDRFGITAAGQAEQNRVRAIRALHITYEEKQVLINRTVFLEASREMVRLALGEPVCVQRVPASEVNLTAQEHFVYYVEDDRRPTRLTFEGDQLKAASKASALDICR